MQTFLDIILVILVADFGSGLLHWFEDSYGDPNWPITGKWITAPNILHHQTPRAFTEHSWLRSAAVLLIIGAVVIGVAWSIGMLTWQLILFVAIGVNANEIHKWNHLPKKKRGKIVVALQDVRLLQSARHHGKHHMSTKGTHYCVVTNLLNPALDAVQLWRGLEWAIEHLLGVSKRPSHIDEHLDEGGARIQAPQTSNEFGGLRIPSPRDWSEPGCDENGRPCPGDPCEVQMSDFTDRER